MSIFLDKNYISKKYDTKYPMNCLVHTYNKKYFNDKDDAINMLMTKVLLPGEVAFGYYYDPDTSYGINAIFAVGPLSNNGGNILFHNLYDINKFKDNLMHIISDLSTNIELIQDFNTQYIENRDELINIINTANESFQNEISQLSDLITNSITDLNTYISQEKENINNIIQSSLDQLEINLKLSNEYSISNLINNDLQLKPDDSFEIAFGKLEKNILDNEKIVSHALNNLYENKLDSSVISKVGLSNDYNDLDNIPSLDNIITKDYVDNSIINLKTYVDSNLKLSNEYSISNLMNNDLKLQSNDSFEIAFGKLEKAIIDNEETITNALIYLNNQIQDISLYIHQHI